MATGRVGRRGLDLTTCTRPRPGMPAVFIPSLTNSVPVADTARVRGNWVVPPPPVPIRRRPR